MTDDVQHTTLAELDWWYVARHYETPEEAISIYNQVKDFAGLMKGLAQIAGYRVLDDLPENGGMPRLVIILGLIEKHVRAVAEYMGGEEWSLSHDEMQGLIIRRIRFLVNADELGAPSGVYGNEYGKSGIRIDHMGRVIPRD